MIELLLEEKRAVIKKDVSIKLTKENVYFTKSSSYTFDIELPLSCNENIAIFGNVNRKDVEVKNMTFPAKLYSDNILLIKGTAIVTQVTELSVKVQLLGGNSEMNFYQKGDSQFIDELDLSNWLAISFGSTFFGDATGSSYAFAYLTWQDFFYFNSPLYTYAGWCNLLWGLNNPWVAFPIYNENNEVQCNNFVMRKKNDQFQIEFRMSHEGNANLANGCPQVKFAIQPYLYFMVERIIQALGYNISSNNNILRQNDFFNKIFIANACNRIELNKALPHWSVNDFITQIEHLFGVVFKIDESTRNVRIVPRNKFMLMGTHYINEVVDEYTTDLQGKEETIDISNGNVGYNDSNIDAYNKIKDDIVSAALIVKDYKTISDLYKYVAYNGLKSSDRNKIFECEGRRFIAKSNDFNIYYLDEVDIFRNRIQNSEKKDVDIELKIVPCKIIDTEISAVTTTKNKNNYDVDTKIGTTNCKCLSRPDRNDFSWNKSDSEATIVDIVDMIENGKESVDAQDIMYVALNSGKLTDVGTINGVSAEYPIAHTSNPIVIDRIGIFQSNYNSNLGLNTVIGSSNLASEVYNNQVKIDTTVKYCFQFISDEIFDPTNLFIIQNKKYVCEKLEIKIDEDGIDRLVTGYFYTYNE